VKRLINNTIIFIVAMFLLFTVGTFGLIYTIVWSVFNSAKISFFKYWADLMYTINVGIDKIGNVLLAAFLNKFAIVEPVYKFGDINDTISEALAKNLNNLTPLGKFIVDVLEWIDPGHMEKSIK
jgi:hypothetical protein